MGSELAVSQATAVAPGPSAWDMAAGDPCKRCGQLALRFANGVCWGCNGELVGLRHATEEKRVLKGHFKRGLREGRVRLADLREGRV